MNQISTDISHTTLMTEDAMVALRERNEIRLEEAKRKLGTKWLLHPDNAAARKIIKLKDAKK